MKATFDPSVNLDLYFRKGMNGNKTLNFFRTNGSEYDLTGINFEFRAPFPVSVNVIGNSIELSIAYSEVINRNTFFYQLVNTSTVRTWLSGTSFFTSDLSANVSDSENIVINLNGETINITISDTASLLIDWDMDTNLFPANSKRGQDYYGVITTSSTLEDRNGNLLPSGVIAKALVNNASTSDPNDWAFTYTIT